jgi:broad specificity phosphatase PhoE
MGPCAIAFLVRHAHTDASDMRLCGRTTGICLSQRGRHESLRLGEQLATVPVNAIYSSPLERARETATAIASVHRLRIDIEESLNEVDFGEWTGRTFDALEPDPEWRSFNEQRSSAVVPNGERPVDVQRRVVMLLTRLANRHRDGHVVLVSHAEVIRSAVLWCLGRSLDDFHQVAIETASITAVLLTSTPRILFINAIELTH